MTGSMTLVLHKDTNHVLALATKTANPEEKPEPGDLVGDGLLIRDATTGRTMLEVEVDDLDTAITEADGSVLVAPRHFEFDKDNDATTELPVLAAPQVTLNGTEVRVDLGAGNNVSGDTDVLVYILGGQMAVTERVTVTIANGDHLGTATFTLPNGAYAALVLPPGSRPFMGQDNVP